MKGKKREMSTGEAVKNRKKMMVLPGNAEKEREESKVPTGDLERNRNQSKMLPTEEKGRNWMKHPSITAKQLKIILNGNCLGDIVIIS